MTHPRQASRLVMAAGATATTAERWHHDKLNVNAFYDQVTFLFVFASLVSPVRILLLLLLRVGI